MTQASLEISLLGEWQYAHKRDVQSVLLKGAPNQVWYFIDLLCDLYFVTFVCCFNTLALEGTLVKFSEGKPK